jgi:uncharacterized protein YndB with AHSA1/START domain
MDNDLSIERVLDAPVAAVWRAWSEHLPEWWCPRPWTTDLHTLDLRPGGRFVTTMHGPEGQSFPGESVFLEIVPERRVVFTNALTAGWQPQSAEPVMMVGLFEMEPEGERTRYRATARHWTADASEQHAAMGFEAGWGAVAVQLEEVARRLA